MNAARVQAQEGEIKALRNAYGADMAVVQQAMQRVRRILEKLAAASPTP